MPGKKTVGKTYYTKRGQPYTILPSGRARFIKKKKKAGAKKAGSVRVGGSIGSSIVSELGRRGRNIVSRTINNNTKTLKAAARIGRHVVRSRVSGLRSAANVANKVLGGSVKRRKRRR